MKQALVNTLKVCAITWIASIPSMMIIGWIIIRFLYLTKINFNFSFSLSTLNLNIFVAILAGSLMLSSYLKATLGYRRYLNDRPVAHGIVIFMIYLVLSNSIHFISLFELAISFGPMMLIAYISSRYFALERNVHLDSVL